MSEVDFPPIEPEVAPLGEENTELTIEYAKRSTNDEELVRLRQENTGLKVENAKLTTNITWLKRVIWGLIGICLILVAALVIPYIKGKTKNKKGSRKGSLAPLFRLLQAIMTEDDVTRLLDLYLGPDGRTVLQSLSASTSTDDFFHKVLVALERRGLLNGAFFAALIAYVPSRRAYILKVQAEFFAGLKDNNDPK